MPDTNMLSTVRSRVSEAEWQARLDCAALYRLQAHFNQIDLIFNHITLRIPGEGHRILINPYGWMYEEITASSLVTIWMATSCSTRTGATSASTTRAMSSTPPCMGRATMSRA